MNEKNIFNLMFQCENCKQTFPVSQEHAPNSLTHKKEYMVNGQSIFLTYYDCPHCGKRHFVQIDDKNSLQELERNKTEFYRLAARRRKGKTISKKQSENFKKARQHLAEYRMKLMKEYTDKSIVDESGTVFILRFSI